MSTGPTNQSVKPKMVSQPDLNQSDPDTGQADHFDQFQQTTSISVKSGLDWHQLHGDSSVSSKQIDSNQGSSVDKAQRKEESGVSGKQPCIRLPHGHASSSAGQSIPVNHSDEVKTGTQVKMQLFNCCLLG